MRKFALVALCVLFFAGLRAAAQTTTPPPVHGVNVGNMDRSVAPGDNFYGYANGSWLKRAEIPPDRAMIGIDSELDDAANKQTVEIIEEIAKADAPAGSNGRKIADLYRSYMNEDAIEAKGLDPVRAQLQAFRAIKDKRGLARVLGEGLRSDVDPLNNTNFHTSNLFGLWVAPGFDDPDRYYPYLLQGGIALPDREYYLEDSDHMRAIRTRYLAHVTAMLEMARFDNPSVRAQRIIELEKAIAEKQASIADTEDVHKADNVWKSSEFSAKAPGLDWTEFFRAAGLSRQGRFFVWQPAAIAGEAALIATVPLETWKDWLAFHLIERYGGALPKAFVEERFSMFGKELYGAQQQRPRWQRGVMTVNDLLGDAVGQIYAQRYFPPESKAQVNAMVANLIAAYRKRIDALPWMDPATRAEAQAKLNALYVGIGYPETWRDYSAYEVRAGDLFGNLWRADLWAYHRDVKRLGGPVDRREWSMTPQTVDAVNLPLQNALNFPAAILQAPYFDPKAPAAVNYGAIGAVIGHEISHTFDTEGSTFDAKGRLRNWWTQADLKHFQDATQQLARQYSAYKPFPDLAINGEQTLAENIADVAGLAASYDAFHASLKGAAAPEHDGFTGDQQFFLAFAQSWLAKEREAALREQIMTDSHSPAEYRADTVRNLDAWYAAFAVQPGARLYLAPAARVLIW
jgi:endothelin-converting enzyme/putative endopeptidase